MFHVFDNVMHLFDCQNFHTFLFITWVCILGRRHYST